jgi:hypothetical protein
MQSNGCPKCAFERLTGGYNLTNAARHKEKLLTKPAKVYFIQCWNDEELFYKVGITTITNEKYRFSGRYFPYNFMFLNTLSTTLYDAIIIENKLLQKLKPLKYIPRQKFNGYTECFIPKSENDVKLIDSLRYILDKMD